MSKTYPFLKINVTENEKERITELAKTNGLSVSAFLKRELSSLLEDTDNTHYQPTYEYQKETRNKECVIYLSEREFETIKVNAKDMSVSAYLRKVGLNGSKVINIDVYDEDIVNLERNIQPKLDSILGIASALKIQRQLHDVQFQKIESLLEAIYKDIRHYTKMKIKERNSIRQTRIRELRKKCNDAIKKEIDSKAKFDIDY